MTFPSWMRDTGKVYREQGSALFVEVPLSGLMTAMKNIKSRGVNAVNAISGYDSGREIELLYHFVHHGAVLTLKTKLSRNSPVVPTVTGIFPSAMLFEQENHEMLGIGFKGNNALKPLLLDSASPATPLKKEEKNEKPKQ